MTNQKEQSLKDKFGAVAIDVNGLYLKISTDSQNFEVISDTPMKIDHHTTSALKTETAITAAKTALKIGDTAKDGWIYAGISDDPKSPGYNKPLWVAPEDSGVMTHYDAKRTAVELSKGNMKVRLPTLIELSQVFNFLAKKGKGGFSQDSYWAKEYKRFSFITTNQKILKQKDIASVRLIR